MYFRHKRDRKYNENYVVLPFLPLSLIYIMWSAEVRGAKYHCKEEGKYKDIENEHRYHQCFFLYGKLRYIHNTCPSTTCFNEELNHCTPTCTDSKISEPLPPPPPPAYESYDCTGRKITCSTKGVFAVPGDQSVYVSCDFKSDRLEGVCFTCNKIKKTCFSNKLQACVLPSDGKRCSKKDPEVSVDVPKLTKVQWILLTTTYDCNGYTHYNPCQDLGVGIFGAPGDISTYWQCTQDSRGKITGECKVCPKEDQHVFAPCSKQCKATVTGQGQVAKHKPYDCSTFISIEFRCEIGGYFTSHDTSIFFRCYWQGKILVPECYTCNRKRKTCYLEQEGSCVTYKGEKCPSKNELDKIIEESDNPEEKVGTPDSSLSYNCSGYDIFSFPCSNYGSGKYPHPGDISIYIVCERNEDWVAKCYPCEDGTCYDQTLMKCTKGGCDIDTLKVPYDCSNYDFNSYPCKTSGYFSNPNDTSVYFQCRPNPHGNGFQSLCYTCSSQRPKTCFMEGSQSCVTTTSKVCGTTQDLEDDKNKKGTPESSRSYSCGGYTNSSFPCHAFKPGIYPMPGDPSVYVKCGKPISANVLSSFEKCYSCSKTLKACYRTEKMACVKNCGDKTVVTKKPPLMPYDCSNREYNCKMNGYFADKLDTSVYYLCVGEDKVWKSLCYTCSKTAKTCFNEKLSACVTNSGKACGTIQELEDEKKKGQPEDSRTYSCAGYSDKSFPCADVEEGYYPYPGDPSVFVHCLQTTNADGSLVTIYESCSVCSKETKSCFISELMMCVPNCGKKEDSIDSGECPANSELDVPCQDDSATTMFGQSTSYFSNCITDVKGKWLKSCYSCTDCTSNTSSPAQIFPGCSCDVDTVEKCPFCQTNETKPNDPDLLDQSEGSHEDDRSKHEEEGEICNLNKWGCNKQMVYENVKTFIVFLTYCLEEGYAKQEGWKKRCEICNPKASNCKGKNGTIVEEEYTTTQPPKPSSPTVDKKNRTSEPTGTPVSKDKAPSKVENVEDEGEDEDDDSELPEHCFVSNNTSKNDTDKADNANSTSVTSSTKELEWVCNVKDKSVNKHVHIENCYENGYGKNQNWRKRCVTCTLQEKVKSEKPNVKWKCNRNDIYKSIRTFVYIDDCIENGYGNYEKWQKRCFKCNQEIEEPPSPPPAQPTPDKKSSNEISVGTPPECIRKPKKDKKKTDKSKKYTYDCSKNADKGFVCKSEGLFENIKDRSLFYHCKRIKDKLTLLCYACNAELKSCFIQEKNACVPGCNQADAAIPEGITCRGYHETAIPCGVLMKEKFRVKPEYYMFSHPGDSFVYFRCVKGPKQNYLAKCYTCPITTCFKQEGQICKRESCDQEISDDVEPYRPYDCRYYATDSYPCTEEGSFANPVETSVYFQCIRRGSSWIAVCHACHKKNTCFVQAYGLCLISKGSKCGNLLTTTSTPGIQGRPYDCSGYDPEASMPCEQLGEGRFGMPGDYSVFWICSRGSGQCQICDKETSSCFIEGKNECTKHCSSKVHRSYDCSSYTKENSFECLKEGFFAQTFDSSIFFRCVKVHGSEFHAECYQCNKNQKTCFSNSIGRCVYSEAPCGDSDPGRVINPNGPIFVGYDCGGYDGFAVPCKYLGAGVFGSQGDQTVYFTCVTHGDILVATCAICPATTRSYYIQPVHKCMENQGMGPAVPYSCASYGEHYFQCNHEGLFAAQDSSVYFRCVKSGGFWGYKAFCYSCDKTHKTCFDQHLGTCRFNNDRPCESASESSTTLIEGPSRGSGTNAPALYDCSGYNTNSFPCHLHGPGNHGTPSDKSIYFECIFRGAKFTAKCHVCSKKTKTFFSELAHQCVGEPVKPYNCSHRTFDCKKRGLFADPQDNSVYYLCSEEDGNLVSHCYACSIHRTPNTICFSQKLQACITTSKQICDNTDPADSDDPGTENNSMTYSCLGYHCDSFPCQQYSKYPEGRRFAVPGDKSIFFTCSNFIAKCTACKAVENMIFVEEQGKCSENMGKGATKPYDCTTHDPIDVAKNICRQPGYFGFSTDTSIFFRCVKGSNGHWEAHGYSCSEKQKTCWSNTAQACVTNPEKDACEGSDPYMDNPEGGTEETSRTFDCDGYNEYSFPCDKYPEPNIKHRHPGDRSVFFTCHLRKGKWKAECHICGEFENSCLGPEIGKDKLECRENCGLGPTISYDCGYRNYHSYNCESVGGYFADPIDASFYYKCVKTRGIFVPYCYACSRKFISWKHTTCFSDELQACISVKGGSISKGCGSIDPVRLAGSGTEESSRTFDCDGYYPTAFPCDRVAVAGRYALPGDKSIYFECAQRSDKSWEGKCRACRKGQCFDEGKRECTRSACGGNPTQPYLCNVDSEYSCTEAGTFAESSDSSIYYRCEAKSDGSFTSSCFTCNRNKKACFSNKKSACLTTSNPCGEDDPADMAGTEDEEKSRAYTCSGYNAKSFPCSAESRPAFKYEKYGDKSVYFTCVMVDGVWVSNCTACPADTLSCFIPSKQQCVEACGKGPITSPEATKPTPVTPPAPTPANNLEASEPPSKPKSKKTAKKKTKKLELED